MLSGCDSIPFGRPGPPPIRPAAFTALGVTAAYLNGDIISGRAARAKKMKAAGIRPLNPAAADGYMYRAEQELRNQTAGIGIDVVRLPDGILVRVPAVMTFDPGSAAIKPQIDATLKEVARTLKTFNQTYVDVLAHSDTIRHAARQSGAVAEARQRGRDVPRRPRRRQGADRFTRLLAKPLRSTIRRPTRRKRRPTAASKSGCPLSRLA